MDNTKKNRVTELFFALLALEAPWLLLFTVMHCCYGNSWWRSKIMFWFTNDQGIYCYQKHLGVFTVLFFELFNRVKSWKTWKLLWASLILFCLKRQKRNVLDYQKLEWCWFFCCNPILIRDTVVILLFVHSTDVMRAYVSFEYDFECFFMSAKSFA